MPSTKWKLMSNAEIVMMFAIQYSSNGLTLFGFDKVYAHDYELRKGKLYKRLK